MPRAVNCEVVIARTCAVDNARTLPVARAARSCVCRAEICALVNDLTLKGLSARSWPVVKATI